MTLWTGVGLLSFRIMILKQDTPAVVRKLSQVFELLQSPPQIDIQTKDDELQLNELDLDPNMVLTIQERTKAKLDKNNKFIKSQI